MPYSSKLRKRGLRPPIRGEAQLARPARWEVLAHAATVGSSLAAAVAILVSSYQFRETMRLQEQSVNLQLQALHMERASKAAEIFSKFLEVRYEWPDLPAGPRRDAFLVDRNNRALRLLNALYETSKGDAQWESIVHWSLQYFERFARERNVRCLNLTSDFTTFIERALPNLPSEPLKMCRDMYDSE